MRVCSALPRFARRPSRPQNHFVCGLLTSPAFSSRACCKFRTLDTRLLAGYPWPVSTDLYPEWVVSALPGVDPEVANAVALVSSRSLAVPVK